MLLYFNWFYINSKGKVSNFLYLYKFFFKFDRLKLHVWIYYKVLKASYASQSSTFLLIIYTQMTHNISVFLCACMYVY